MKKPLFGTLDRILLVYMFGAALGAATFVYLLSLVGILPGIVAVFLVPTVLGCILIDRAYRAGIRTGQQAVVETRE